MTIFISPFVNSSETKKSPTEKICQGRMFYHPRCHLDFTFYRALLRILIYPRQLTGVYRRRILGKKAFDYALRGPFDDLFLTWLSATQVLCEGIIAVISASTVFLIISHKNHDVKKKIQISLNKNYALNWKEKKNSKNDLKKQLLCGIIIEKEKRNITPA